MTIWHKHKRISALFNRIGAAESSPATGYARVFVILLVLSVVTVACSGLGGEPDIVATIPPSAPTEVLPADIGFPQSPPDLANGAQIFAERCVECHGANGEGDGELVVAGQVPDPGNFRDPASAREQSPQDWFSTITNGNLENLMPPWRQALTEQERWDVALYTYTMHYTPEQLALGEEIFARECIDCHGENGAGDGEEAVANDLLVPPLNDPERMVEIDDDAMFVFINEGASPDMPAFGEEGLSEDDIRAVAAYARTLSLTNPDVLTRVDMEVVTTQEAPIEDSATESAPSDVPLTTVMDITGTVVNRTSDGDVPEGLTVNLRVFDATTFEEFVEDARQTTIDANTDFVFEDVTVSSERLYLTAVEYNGRNFASGVFPGATEGETMELPIDVYEITSDPDAIEIVALVERVNVVGDSIEVQRLTQFTNTSERVFTETEQQENGLYRSVQMSLPPGAVVVGFDNDSAYTVSEDGMTAYDMRPMIPGETRLNVMEYVVAYGGGAIIEYPLDYLVAGEVRVLVTPYDTMSVESEQLPGLGEEAIGGVFYQAYGERLALPAGTPLRYELIGIPAPAAAQPGTGSGDGSGSAPAPRSDTDGNNLPILILGVGILVIGALMIVAVFVRRNHDPEEAELNRKVDQLVNQIAALDAKHDRGEINHDVYRRQKADLNAQLADLMGTSDE